jgi:hypothetical protein|tara:strand:- start:1122 stop:1871 length:750 start_codon:yes stop_codon:yes gene_type:complete
MEIARRNGELDLTSLHPDCLSDHDSAAYERIIPCHDGNHPLGILTDIIDKAEKHHKPLAKEVENIEELERDILMVYQVSYAHYVIAKHYNFLDPDRRFPKYCCGPSARGMTASLWLHGFLNAAHVLSEPSPNHCYVVLPFVMLDPPMKGVILADPTSDQLGAYEGKTVRNLVTVKQGKEWTYITQYDDKRDLFPTRLLYLGSLLQNGVITDTGSLTDDEYLHFKGGKKFLKYAFKHAIPLDTPTINRGA